MEGASSSSFPANYVTLKDLQERWIKRKQEEENEEKLRRVREEEAVKSHNEKKAKNHLLKSRTPTYSESKSPSSPAALASRSQVRERKIKNLANGFNGSEGKVKKATDENFETSAAIAGRRNDLQESRIKGKQEEENEEKVRRLREEENIKAHNKKEAKNHQFKSKKPIYSDKKSPTSPAAAASHSQGRERKEKNLANGLNEGKVKNATDENSETSDSIAGRRKDLQESRKDKLEEEKEEKVHRLREKEDIKAYNKKEAKNHQFKSKNPIYSEKKSPTSPAAAASHSQRRERKEKNLANGFNATEGKINKATDAKSEKSAAIANRSRANKRKSGRSRIATSESESVVKIGDKREDEEEKVLESARGDQMAKIYRQVADLSVGASGNRRGGRISGGEAFKGRRLGGTPRFSASAAGMMWVRKTPDV